MTRSSGTRETRPRLLGYPGGKAGQGGPMSHFHELRMQAITGENVDFSEYEGTLSLVVNVASR